MNQQVKAALHQILIRFLSDLMTQGKLRLRLCAEPRYKLGMLTHLHQVARMLRLMEILVLSGTEAIRTKRDIFYMDTRLFVKQAAVDSLIKQLAIHLNIPRLDLGISASPKGLIYGDFVMHNEHNLRIDFGQFPKLISMDLTTVMNFDEGMVPLNVCIIEKEAVFTTILQALPNIQSIIKPTLWVCGRGYPDLLTMKLVNSLSKQLPPSTRFLILVDYDPYGLDIALRYRLGSTLPADKNTSNCDRLEFLGIQIKQMDYYSDQLSPDQSRHALTPRLRQIINRIISKASEIGWSAIEQAAREMKSVGYCSEIESLYRSDFSILERYLSDHLR